METKNITKKAKVNLESSHKKKDPQSLALKLALALSGSSQKVVNEFSFFDAKGVPLYASKLEKGLVLGY